MTHWPAKKKSEARRCLRALLASKFEVGRTYTEREVNAILESWHTFGDHAFLRRDLVDHDLLQRTIDGREYRRANG
ncbi:MAG TPA: DUF2087 domain-containing protein [Fimbriimonadaceae bacterium]|nr:DUF2087 domain-containing protein [Fimbriimonadaceae bacterium]